MPHLSGSDFGDLYVETQVKIPIKLSRRAKKLIMELDDELSR